MPALNLNQESKNPCNKSSNSIEHCVSIILYNIGYKYSISKAEVKEVGGTQESFKEKKPKV